MRDGPDLPNILGLAEKLNVKVEHYGFLSRNDYLNLMSTSTHFVNLSAYEAFSIVVAEAISLGLNVVAALPWGITFEDFDKVSLVNGNSPVQVANCIINPSTNERGRSSRNEILLWSQVAEQMVEKIYLPLLRSKNLA